MCNYILPDMLDLVEQGPLIVLCIDSIMSLARGSAHDN